MNKKWASWTTAIVALVCCSALWAHHSVRMIDVSTAVWIKGTVVSYKPISPHTMFELEETKADGQVQQSHSQPQWDAGRRRFFERRRCRRGVRLLSEAKWLAE